VKSYADYTNGWTHEGGGVYCKITMAEAAVADTDEPKGDEQ
jgi:hypothetical protein